MKKRLSELKSKNEGLRKEVEDLVQQRDEFLDLEEDIDLYKYKMNLETAVNVLEKDYQEQMDDTAKLRKEVEGLQQKLEDLTAAECNLKKLHPNEAEQIDYLKSLKCKA